MNKKLFVLITFLCISNSIRGMQPKQIQPYPKMQDACIQTNPFVDAEEKCILALECLKMDDCKSAFILFQESKDQGYLPARLMLSVFLFNQNKPREAIEELNIFLSTNNNNYQIDIGDKKLFSFFKKTISKFASLRKKINFLNTLNKKLNNLMPKEEISPEVLQSMYT